MAFNLKTFRTRTLTAVIFGAVMLTGLLWNQWSFLILFSIIHFGCWWEFFNLLEKIHSSSVHRYIRLGFILTGFSIMLLFTDTSYRINDYHLKENFSLPLSIAGFVMLVMGVIRSERIHLRSFAVAFSGLIYLSLCWGLMISLREWGSFENDKEFWNKALPLGLVISIWVNDTMAYIVGSLIGRTPLSRVSPKKTWEGTFGGIILSVGIVVFVFYNMWEIFTWTDWLLISLIAAVTGTSGDLLQSKIKRMAGVKDSGSLMPGHGGFLDRFDSLLIATPCVWIYMYLFMR